MTARGFAGCSPKSLANRGWVVAGTAGAFVIAVILFGFVQQQFFPSSSRPELMIDLRLAQNASIAATEAEGAALRESPARPIRTSIPQLLRGLGRGALLSTAQPAARERQLRAGRGHHEELRGARRGARAARRRCCAEDFGTLMARVEPLALGPPVDWPLQYRVSGPDVRGVRAIGRNRGRRRCARTPIRAWSISTGTR